MQRRLVVLYLSDVASPRIPPQRRKVQRSLQRQAILIYLCLFNPDLKLHRDRRWGDQFWFCYTFSVHGRGGQWLSDMCAGKDEMELIEEKD